MNDRVFGFSPFYGKKIPTRSGTLIINEYLAFRIPYKKGGERQQNKNKHIKLYHLQF